MAYTTSDLQEIFESAFDDTAPAGNSPNDPLTLLVAAIRADERDKAALVAAGTLTTTSANGRTASMVFDGRTPGALTTKDAKDARRDLLNRIQKAFGFIRGCFKYGLDPQAVELQGCINPLPAPVANPAEVTRTIMAEWLMGEDWCLLKGLTGTHGWLSHLFAITECQSDYSRGRVAFGTEFV